MSRRVIVRASVSESTPTISPIVVVPDSTTRLSPIGKVRKMARLSITLAPALGPDPIAGLTVKRDGVVLGAASLGVALPLDPGAHLVLVSATGRQARKKPTAACALGLLA